MPGPDNVVALNRGDPWSMPEEQHVLHRYKHGHTPSAIADELGRTVDEVKEKLTRLKSILGKLEQQQRTKRYHEVDNTEENGPALPAVFKRRCPCGTVFAGRDVGTVLCDECRGRVAGK